MIPQARMPLKTGIFNAPPCSVRRLPGLSLFPPELIFGIEFENSETERGFGRMMVYLLILIGALYFLFPYDLLPDFLPAFGRIDDLLMMAYLYWVYYKKYKRAPSSGSETSYRGQDGAYGQGGSYEQDRAQGGSWGRSNDGGMRPRRNRDPYEILGTSRSASQEEIKHAYRLQANRYHPDRVAHLGEDLQALAKEKFQDIQWAYEQLTRGRT